MMEWPGQTGFSRFGARIASSPVFFAVLFGLGALLSVYADVYPGEIVLAITPRPGYFDGPFASHAAMFYGVLALLVLFTGFVQWAADATHRRDEERRASDERALIAATAKLNAQVQAADLRRAAAEERLLEATGHLEEAHRRRAEAEDRLLEGTRQLRHLLRTLPPATALTTFDDIELQAQDVAAAVGERLHAGLHEDGADTLEPDEVAAAVRVVLKGVARLVAVFDAGGHETTYMVDVARFVPAATLGRMPDVERGRLASQMLTWPGPAPFAGVRGVLVLDRAMATSSHAAGEDVREDPLTELAFAVPHVELEKVAGVREDRWRVLPGPPLAFCRRSSVLYHDQGSILRWCRRRAAYPDGTMERLESYFRTGAGAAVQGLLSVPIVRYGEQIAGDESIPAVLNVSCNGAGFLRGRHVRRHLLPLLYPLMGVLQRLLSVLVVVERSASERVAAGAAKPSRADFVHGLSIRGEAMDRFVPRMVVAREHDGVTTMRIADLPTDDDLSPSPQSSRTPAGSRARPRAPRPRDSSPAR